MTDGKLTKGASTALPARDFRPGVIVAVALISTLAVACAPRVALHGNRPNADELTQIQTGVTSQSEVAGLLGSPSSIAAFSPNIWYYISKETERTAFLKPATVSREVVEIHFDDAGTVTELKTYDLTDGHKLEIVERETPTAGHNLTFIEQLMGNVGRFNKNSNNN